ncbi:MAG: energy transducer TonB [Massilia sp.]
MLALHLLVLALFIGADRIVLPKIPVDARIMAVLVPDAPKPPPPPPPPESPKAKPDPVKAPSPLRESAARPLRDIEVKPQTEIVATVIENALPVEVAGGKADANGSAGSGKTGAGTAAAGGGGSVKVRAIIDPNKCERPRLTGIAARRFDMVGDVVLAIKIDVDGSVPRARVVRSSGFAPLDEAAIEGSTHCRFVAAKVDGVPVASWELFRFSWSNSDR